MLRFLRYLTIAASLYVVSSIILEQECIKVYRSIYNCYCDINYKVFYIIKGTGSYSPSYDGVATIKPVYDKLDHLAANKTGEYFAIYLQNEEVRTLRVPLFPSNIKVIYVQLHLDNLATIPANLFQWQINNIRVVDLKTPLISTYSVDALQGLTKMYRLKLNSESMVINSFDSFASKDTLHSFEASSSVSLTFDSAALAAIRNLKYLTLSTKLIDVDALLDSLSGNLSTFKTLTIRNAKFPSFPIKLVKEIIKRGSSPYILEFHHNQMTTMKASDWSFLINNGVKFVELSGNILDCSCDLIPMIKATKQKKLRVYDGQCKKGNTYTVLRYLQTTMKRFKNCTK